MLMFGFESLSVLTGILSILGIVFCVTGFPVVLCKVGAYAALAFGCDLSCTMYMSFTMFW